MKISELIAAKSNFEDNTKWLPFSVHASDTAGIIKRLFNKWIAENVRRRLCAAIGIESSENAEAIVCNYCEFIALVHDIGKLTPAFQRKLKDNIQGLADRLLDAGIDLSDLTQISESPHNIAGQYILKKEFEVAPSTAVIVGAHHGDCSADRGQCSYEANYYGHGKVNVNEWTQIRAEWMEYALSVTGFENVRNLPNPDIAAQMLITGLLVMSDWIASNTDYFHYIDIEEKLTDEQCEERVRRAWNKLSLTDSWYADFIADNDSFFEERFGFRPNCVQREFMNVVSLCNKPGIYILEAPMGIGKTEAALAATEILASRFGYGGMFFGLPTQATANGIFDRIHSWASGTDDIHSLRLAHGMTDMNDEYCEMFHGRASDISDDDNDNIMVHTWFEGRKQALLSEFVVATVDQFLMASLKQKHVMLRHLGLAGKTVIIDECHAYSSYMYVYLGNSLRWMAAYNVPVIILSATLPPDKRAELIRWYTGSKNCFDNSSTAYPILTWSDGAEVNQKAIPVDIPDKSITVIRREENDSNDIVNLLEDKLSDGGCAAVIVNSVAYSQELADTIAANMPDYRVICFHSRFISTDRASIERELTELVGKKSTCEKRDKLIVVGTQVIEQSLDIDFDYMITELCPMDLLLQRSGRLHRHNRTRPDKLSEPELCVLIPEDFSKSVYSGWILTQTEKYLPDKLVIPGCIPKLVGAVYSEPDNDEQQTAEYRKYSDEQKEKKQRARKYCIPSQKINRSDSTLSDMIDRRELNNDSDGEAAVRDGQETIEALVLVKTSDTEYSLFSRDAVFDITSVPDNAQAKLIAKQRLRLPAFFSKSYNFGKTIEILANAMPQAWRNAKWLKGEILLLLEGNNKINLLGRTYKYSTERGFEEIKEEES